VTILEGVDAAQFFDARRLLGPHPAPTGEAEQARANEQASAGLGNGGETSIECFEYGRSEAAGRFQCADSARLALLQHARNEGTATSQPSKAPRPSTVAMVSPRRGRASRGLKTTPPKGHRLIRPRRKPGHSGALGPYAAPSLVPLRVGVRAKPRGMAGKDRGRAERAPEICAETD
jgi:hypothetical protein